MACRGMVIQGNTGNTQGTTGGMQENTNEYKNPISPFEPRMTSYGTHLALYYTEKNSMHVDRGSRSWVCAQ
jgi:hypothetical protein